MFVCEKCHEKHFGEDPHFFRSYGVCEFCGRTSACGDCHCEPKRKKTKKRRKS